MMLGCSLLYRRPRIRALVGALFVGICRLAVDALPVFVACAVGFSASEMGAGPIGALVVALIAGAGTLAAGRFLFASASSGALRLLVILLFSAPAAFTGYVGAVFMLRRSQNRRPDAMIWFTDST